MAIALIQDGRVADIKQKSIEDVPEHKRYLWRTIIDSPPTYNSWLETIAHDDWEIDDTNAVMKYTITPKDRATHIAAVKAEAQRRIILRTGGQDLMGAVIKQLNALMKAVTVVNKKVDNTVLSEDLENAAVLTALAADIEFIRNRSNAIELLDPIPEDYAADYRWTP